MNWNLLTGIFSRFRLEFRFESHDTDGWTTGEKPETVWVWIRLFSIKISNVLYRIRSNIHSRNVRDLLICHLDRPRLVFFTFHPARRQGVLSKRWRRFHTVCTLLPLTNCTFRSCSLAVIYLYMKRLATIFIGSMQVYFALGYTHNRSLDVPYRNPQRVNHLLISFLNIF